jgi:hypothetical protein
MGDLVSVGHFTSDVYNHEVGWRWWWGGRGGVDWWVGGCDLVSVGHFTSDVHNHKVGCGGVGALGWGAGGGGGWVTWCLWATSPATCTTMTWVLVGLGAVHEVSECDDTGVAMKADKGAGEASDSSREGGAPSWGGGVAGVGGQRVCLRCLEHDTCFDHVCLAT